MEIFKELNLDGIIIKVSNEGRVFQDGKERTFTLNHDGYYQLSIGNKTRRVHRLVALAFLENDNPKIKTEVNHKDFNRTNNKLENLEWISHLDNVRHSRENGRYPDFKGENNPNYGNTKLSEKYKNNPELALEKQSRKGTQNGMSKSITVYKDGELIKHFDLIGDCCDYMHLHYGFSSNKETIRANIRKAMNQNRAYRGFTFEK